MRPHITILGTGGTIASTDSTTGAKPSKRSEELVEAVPQLDDYADIDVREVAQRPSFDMDFSTLETLRQTIEQGVADSTDGIVVTHGTDTMEESAYYLDLTLDIDVPVIFTGAQRRPDEVSSDGPANLLTAVRVLSENRIRKSNGVYLAFDEELHAARDVTKRHTRKLNTFKSPEKGPIAAITRDEVRIYREPKSYSVDLDGDPSNTDVRMIKSGVGIDASQIDEALDGGVDGLVLEGTGLGNTTEALGDAVKQALSADVPVVVTSRCYAGATAPVYGTGGGGQTLVDHGALLGDDLPAHKARIKLLLALSVVDDPSEVESVFTSDRSQ
ncbi:asparaginase [Haladaptatus sp. NG-WS-4]